MIQSTSIKSLLKMLFFLAGKSCLESNWFWNDYHPQNLSSQGSLSSKYVATFWALLKYQVEYYIDLQYIGLFLQNWLRHNYLTITSIFKLQKRKTIRISWGISIMLECPYIAMDCWLHHQRNVDVWPPDKLQT